jgi:hypothetical protein
MPVAYLDRLATLKHPLILGFSGCRNKSIAGPLGIPKRIQLAASAFKSRVFAEPLLTSARQPKLLRNHQPNAAEPVMSATTIGQFSFNGVRRVLGGVLGADPHTKRIDSLCNAALGVMHSASLAVAAIGHGLAAARGLAGKHAIKPVDRLLSNASIKVDDILASWVPYIVGARTSITVAMDWTDFDADNQATIMLSLITDHGRATPLVWLTVDKKTLKHQRNLYEDRLLVRLAEILPPHVKVRIIADRGFGD